METELKRGIAAVFLSNVLVVCFSLLTGFLLPKYLSEENYAEIRAFQLYITYIGIFHFGYVDGMYLRYGGKELDGKWNDDLASNISTMRFFQLAIAVMALAVSLFSGNYLWIAFALSIFPVNLRTYYSFLYQAVGLFRHYGFIMTAVAALQFAANVLLLFFIRTFQARVYVFAYVGIYLITWLMLELHFLTTHKLPVRGKPSIPEIKECVVKGMPLLLGGLAAMLMVNMDQWFVMGFMSAAVFAHYAFAANVNNLLFNAVTPVTTTLYNYFCREKEQAGRLRILLYVSVFAVVLPIAAYPVCFVLERLLPAYADVKPVIVVLFAAEIFYTVVNAVFVNLYKASGRTRRYFLKMLGPLCAGLIANLVISLTAGQMLHHTYVVFAMYLLWYIISLNDFKELKIPVTFSVFLVVEAGMFLLTALNLTPVQGILSYAGVTLLAIAFLFRRYYHITAKQ